MNMGLFSKKVELQKDFFTSCLDMAKNDVCDFRERQGFKVKLSSDNKSTLVEAEIGGYFRFFAVTNVFYTNGERECRFFFSGFERSEVNTFFELNFAKTNRGYNDRILPNGEILKWNCLASSDSHSYSIFTK